jgi:hypothetical protein
LQLTGRTAHRGGQKLFYFTDPNGYVIAVTQKQTW